MSFDVWFSFYFLLLKPRIFALLCRRHLKFIIIYPYVKYRHSADIWPMLRVNELNDQQ